MKKKRYRRRPQLVADHTVIPQLRLQADVETKVGLSFQVLQLRAGVWHACFRDGRCVPVRHLLHHRAAAGCTDWAQAI